MKKISDELWLAVIFLLSALFLFAMSKNYLIITLIFAFAGIFLLIIDNIKKPDTEVSVEKK